MKRASDKLHRLRVIGRLNPWVWITGRKVKGVISGKPEATTLDPPDWLALAPDAGDIDFR